MVDKETRDSINLIELVKSDSSVNRATEVIPVWEYLGDKSFNIGDCLIDNKIRTRILPVVSPRLVEDLLLEVLMWDEAEFFDEEDEKPQSFLALWANTDGCAVEGVGLCATQGRHTWVPLFDLYDSDRFGGR